MSIGSEVRDPRCALVAELGRVEQTVGSGEVMCVDKLRGMTRSQPAAENKGQSASCIDAKAAGVRPK